MPRAPEIGTSIDWGRTPLGRRDDAPVRTNGNTKTVMAIRKLRSAFLSRAGEAKGSAIGGAVGTDSVWFASAGFSDPGINAQSYSGLR